MPRQTGVSGRDSNTLLGMPQPLSYNNNGNMYARRRESGANATESVNAFDTNGHINSYSQKRIGGGPASYDTEKSGMMDGRNF